MAGGCDPGTSELAVDSSVSMGCVVGGVGRCAVAASVGVVVLRRFDGRVSVVLAEGRRGAAEITVSSWPVTGTWEGFTSTHSLDLSFKSLVVDGAGTYTGVGSTVSAVRGGGVGRGAVGFDTAGVGIGVETDDFRFGAGTGFDVVLCGGFACAAVWGEDDSLTDGSVGALSATGSSGAEAGGSCSGAVAVAVKVAVPGVAG